MGILGEKLIFSNLGFYGVICGCIFVVVGNSGCSDKFSIEKKVSSQLPKNSQLEEPKLEISDAKGASREAVLAKFAQKSAAMQNQAGGATTYSAEEVLNALFGELTPEEIAAFKSQGNIVPPTEAELAQIAQNEAALAEIQASRCSLSDSLSDQRVPTFQDVILPIMNKYCVPCHRPTFQTNFISNKLLTGKAIADIRSGRMPSVGFAQPSNCFKELIYRWEGAGGP